MPNAPLSLSIDDERSRPRTSNGFKIDLKIKNKQDKNKQDKHSSGSNSKDAVDSSNVRYFKLPFIGQFSKVTQVKINNLCKRFCKDLNIKLIFISFKVKTFFQNKDAIPMLLKSSVVYKFTCAGCGSRYVGETSRHLSTTDKRAFGI